MKQGNKTIDYKIYGKVVGGTLEELGDTTDLELPEIEYKTDTVKGAGIIGEIDWPSYLNISAMSFKAKLRTDNAACSKYFTPGRKWFEVRWITDVFETPNANIGTASHKASMLCLPKKYSPGKIETGSSSDTELDYEVVYYKKEVDGEIVIEIDKLNYVYRINGIDYAESIRNSL